MRTLKNKFKSRLQGKHQKGAYVYLNQKTSRRDFPVGTVVKNPPTRTSLGAQWLRIHLPTKGTWVRALVREDPTCRGATKPVRHNY